MLQSKERQVVKEKFAELYLDHVSEFDIEFLYNYIIDTDKIKERYTFMSNSVA